MKGILLLAAMLAAVAAFRPGTAAAQQSACNLGNGVKHVVYIQFDNVHFRRDNPNVPSDLEQIPNLLNFLEGNGSVLTNHWTPLISHTSVDIATALTGVYGDKFGFSIGNSFGLFQNGVASFPSSFTYWTDVLPDGKYQMLAPDGKTPRRHGLRLPAPAAMSALFRSPIWNSKTSPATSTTCSARARRKQWKQRRIRPRQWPISRASLSIAPRAARSAPRTARPTA